MVENLCPFFYYRSGSSKISGGSNTKKYLLSPLQHRLSQFLICVFGAESSSEIITSFHKPINVEDKKDIDYSTKVNQDRIINFAKSNEILKSRLLDENSLPEDFLKDEILNTQNNSNLSDETITIEDKNSNEN